MRKLLLVGLILIAFSCNDFEVKIPPPECEVNQTGELSIINLTGKRYQWIERNDSTIAYGPNSADIEWLRKEPAGVNKYTLFFGDAPPVSRNFEVTPCEMNILKFE